MPCLHGLRWVIVVLLHRFLLLDPVVQIQFWGVLGGDKASASFICSFLQITDHFDASFLLVEG